MTPPAELLHLLEGLPEPRIVLDTINVTYSASGAVTAELSGMLTETMEKSTRAVTLRSATDADN